MDCLYLNNYWVTKRSRSVADGAWSVFLWGMQATSMFKALETAANKPPSCFRITQHSDVLWNCVDAESEAIYVVERRDDMPKMPKKCNFTVRDQTIQIGGERKKMPVPGSLFK